MSWNSWSDFWSMGGYALYVWGSYGVTAALLIGEILAVRGRRRATISRLARLRRLGADRHEQ
jgi:heme exporter protein D